jgi:hypothetical protein
MKKRVDATQGMGGDAAADVVEVLRARRVALLGVDLTQWPRSAQLSAVIATIFLSFGLYSLLQEQLFKAWGFSWPLFHSMLQCSCYCLFAYAEHVGEPVPASNSRRHKGEKSGQTVLGRVSSALWRKRLVVAIGLSVLAARVLSNVATTRLDVAVKVVVQATKALSSSHS